MWDVQVKEEPLAWEAASACAELYAGHEVKPDLVVGAEVLQPPDIAFRPKPNFEVHVTVVKEELNDVEPDTEGNKDFNERCQDMKNRGQQLVLKPCTVRVERMPLQTEQYSKINDKIQCKILDCKSKNSETETHNLLKDIVKTNLSNKLEACTRKGPFACDTCGLRFTLRSKIVRHLHTCLKLAPKRRRKIITNGPSRKARNKQLKYEQKHSGEKPYKCVVCEKQYSQSSHLYRHMRTHAPKPPVKKNYPCSICNKQYRVEYDLVAHMRIHTGQLPYICQSCGKQFNKKSTLINHEKIHAEYRPYSCEVCNRQFTVKWSLTKHKRRHSNEYPYSCDLCIKKFMHSYSLTKHKRKKHLKKSNV